MYKTRVKMNEKDIYINNQKHDKRDREGNDQVWLNNKGCGFLPMLLMTQCYI